MPFGGVALKSFRFLPARVTGARLAVLFDIDGTLIETLDPILEAMNAALADVGEPPVRVEELRPLIGMPVARQMQILRGLDGPVTDKITDAYYERFGALVERGVRLYPEVRETFPSLRGRRIGTMTTRRRRNAARMLEVAGIAAHFDAIVGGDEVSRPKPAPDLPRHAARAIGVPPDRCVVVGDAPVDVEAGRAAGAWTVAVTYGYGDPPEIRRSEPDGWLDRFGDLPGVLARLDARARGP